MTQRRASETLVRQWQLIEGLGSMASGCTVRELTEALGVSRSTLYRDLAGLRASGVELDTLVVAGKVHWKLPAPRACQVSPSPLQLAALRLARRSLSALEGKAGVLELDALLANWSRPAAPLAQVISPHEPATSPDSLLEAALRCGECVQIAYRHGDGWRAERRRVTPLAHVDRDGRPCVLFVDLEDSTAICLEVSAILRVEPIEQPGRLPSEGRLGPAEGRSFGVTQPLSIEVRLSARAACRLVRFPPVGEGQTIDPDTENTVIVRVKMRSLTEARRWVLSFGADAEALAPDELRSDLAEEAHRMDTLYWRRPFRVAKVSEPNDTFQPVAERSNLAAR